MFSRATLFSSQLMRRGEYGLSNPAMAQDVLEGGLSQCERDAVAKSRVSLALAELHARGGRWERVEDASTCAIQSSSNVQDDKGGIECFRQGMWWNHVACMAMDKEPHQPSSGYVWPPLSRLTHSFVDGSASNATLASPRA